MLSKLRYENIMQYLIYLPTIINYKTEGTNENFTNSFFG